MVGGSPLDTRGIVDPGRMLDVVTLRRYDAGPALSGLVDWFWAVAWDLPPGRVREQQVLNHPSGNVSVGTTDDYGATVDRPRGRIYGVATRLSTRRLTGPGWTVAAKTTTGGLGALSSCPARTLTDRVVPLGALGIDGAALVPRVADCPDEEWRIDLLRAALDEVVARADPGRVAQAREVAAVASRAERDRTIRRVEDLARVAGVGVRTLQRLFAEYAGVSPLFVVRRWRIIEAAERAAAGEAVDWARVAADLGYADQPHLVRDFTRHLGVSPAAYLARQRR